MNLFFAYLLSISPALNDVICVLIMIFCACAFLCFLALANEPEESQEYKRAKESVLFVIKLLAVLAILWVLIPSQPRLNTILLNHSAACVDVRDEYGVQK